MEPVFRDFPKNHLRQHMSVDIIIVNWNAGEQLRDCIASVRSHHSELVGKCIVVDNGSTDGSADFLDGASDVEVMRAEQNLGFGRACNLGALHCTSPFILLLNPDACLLEGSLTLPLKTLQLPELAGLGIVGVQLLDENGAVQRTCARFPKMWLMLAKSVGVSTLIRQIDFHMQDWDHLETRPVDHVIGAFFFMRRSLFDLLGGFDERFFVYLEDLDFSRRAAQAGYGTLYLTGAQAFHKGGGVSDQVKAHRMFYSLRSRLQYAAKHFSRAASAMVAVTTLFVEPVSRLGLLLLSSRWAEITDLGKGYRMLWSWVLGQIIARITGRAL
jgi:GT2 family glycosyltransferase